MISIEIKDENGLTLFVKEFDCVGKFVHFIVDRESDLQELGFVHMYGFKAWENMIKESL